MTLRQIAPDVPEFLQVVRHLSLGGFDPEWRVAARTATTRDGVFALRLLGQGEKCFRLLLGALNQVVGNAVVCDDREAVVLEASPELLGEGVGIAVGVVQRNGRDFVSSDGSHGVGL